MREARTRKEMQLFGMKFNFFMWQYIARNEDYRSRLEEYIKTRKIEDACAISRAFGVVEPVKYDFKTDIDELFKSHTKINIFSVAVPPVSFVDHDCAYIEEKEDPEDPIIVTYTMNTNKPLEIILAEVEYWWNRSQLSNQTPGSPEEEKYNRLVTLYKDALYKHYRSILKQPDSRFMGLWLYDHFVKTGERAKAGMEHFRKSITAAALGLLDVDPANAHDWLTCTEDCVRSGKIRGCYSRQTQIKKSR